MHTLIKQRAVFNQTIRDFFTGRDVLEVETPILAASSIPDSNIRSFSSTCALSQNKYYLQTSPEFHMKRLLAAGSGPIFQISKAFRMGEAGHRHNPEFSMLEWYRPGFSLLELMHEVAALLTTVLDCGKAHYQSYQDCFKQTLNVDPLTQNAAAIQSFAHKQNPEWQSLNDLKKDDWLDLLFSTYIQPHLGATGPAFIYNYPASQAALAKLNLDMTTARRFEVFYQGIELGNGFDELNDSKEQHQRFEAYNQIRIDKNMPTIPIDERFIQSLDKLPDTSGVAVGLDRLLMLKLGKSSIKEVLLFPVEEA